MPKKRVLIYSQAFFPDHSGIPIYSSDFAFYCAEKGYEVDVITGFPFYPQWQKRKEDKGKFFSKEFVKGVSIYRGYLYVSQNPSSFERIIHELSLVLFAFFNSIKVKRPDIIVVFTTPVLLGALAAFMNLFWRRKLIINVQDFQIEAAYSLKMLNGSFALKVLNKLELWSYKKANFVSSISHSMVEMLSNNKDLRSDKVLFWPNWIKNNHSFNPENSKGKFREKIDVSDDIHLIGYAGNIGKKQGLEVLVDVASQYALNKKILFLMIGEGSGLESLKQYAHEKNIDNIRFLPFLNPKEYNEYLLDVNAVFISQAKVPFDIYFPSKLLGVMLYERIIIISADLNSELYKTMHDNNLALTADYDDVTLLCKYIDYVANSHPLVNKYIANSKAFVKQYDREVVLDEICRHIY